MNVSEPSLFRKLLAFGLGLVVVSGLVLTGCFYAYARRMMAAELTLRAETIAQALATNARRGVETGNVFHTLEPLAAAELERRGMLRVEIIDADGRALAQAGSPVPQEGEAVAASRSILSAAETLSAPAPEGARRRIGSVRVWLSTRPLRAELRRALLFSVLLLVLVLLGALALAWGLARRLSLPIGELAQAAGRVGAGELGAAVPVRSRDETGRLAEAFNLMSERLRESSGALRVSEERVRLLLDSTAEGIYGIDTEGRCTFANDACLRLLGYRRAEELLGRNMHELIHHSGADGKPLPADKCRVCRSFLEGVSSGAEGEVLWRADGSRLLAERWSRPVARGGMSVGAVVSFVDITERKQLEARVAQSTKLAAVGQLAAGVAHEINNPLGIILGFAESLARRLKEDDSLSLPVRSIQREALRCKSLVQALLVFSRRQPVPTAAFDVNAAVAGALSLVRAQAGLKSVEVAAELGDAGRARGDGGQAQQVVINLCSNAVDALPEGGRLVVRTARLRRGPQAWVLIEVEDNGPGIPPEIRERIFEPFFTTKEPGKGTGLGLAIVHEIAARSGGTVEVDSELGRGARFRVLLPSADVV